MKSLAFALVLPFLLSPASASEHRILMPDGSAAAEVEVRLVKSGKPDQIFKTDKGGRVELPDPEPNTHRHGALVVDTPGAALGIWNFTARGDLQLKPAFNLSGKVEFPDKTPVEGATVSVLEVGTRTYMPLVPYGADPPWDSVRTNEKGEFTFRGATFNGADFAPGLIVKAEKEIDGRLHTVAEGMLGMGDADFFKNEAREKEKTDPFVLRSTGEVRGQVVNDLTGEPLADVEILFYPRRGDQKVKAMTDAEGRFRLENVPTYAPRTFLVRKSDFAQLSLRETEREPENRAPDLSDLRIALPPLVQVSGLVVDAHTNAPAVFRVGLDASRIYESEPGWEVRMDASAIIKDDGAFAERLPAGPLEIVVASDFTGPYRHSWEIEIQPNQEPLTLELPRQPGLVFELSIPGNPSLEDPIWNQLSPRFGIVGENSFRYARGRNRWFAKADEWGEKIELSIESYVGGGNRIVFERTEYEVQPLKWPVRIRLDEAAISAPEN